MEEETAGEDRKGEGQEEEVRERGGRVGGSGVMDDVGTATMKPIGRGINILGTQSGMDVRSEIDIGGGRSEAIMRKEVTAMGTHGTHKTRRKEEEVL